MSDGKHIMIPEGFAATGISKKFAQEVITNDLAEGIKGGFAIMGYKGKVWSTKFQGNEKPLMREDGDGPRASIEVVIVRASKNIAKIYYENGFVDGSTAPPDCWSTNGVAPDGASPKKQSTTCAGCPQNAWGSKVTDAGKQTKACSDSKRLAIVPLNDISNELMGGPMLLRNPAASLKDLKAYGDQLQAYGYPYYAVATRIAFDVNEAYPKFVFTAIRPLTDAEAEVVLDMRDDPRVNSILSESVETVHHEPVAALPATPFEQPQTLTPAPAPEPHPGSVAAAQAAEANKQAQTPATPAVAAEPGKRKRRTQAEMLAAAEALKAQREGKIAPVAQAAAPAAEPAQPTPTAANDPAVEDFDSMMEGLLPK
jgi:hypothetical protein